MRHFFLTFTVLVLAAAAYCDDKAPPTNTPLEGEWTMVGGEIDGKPLPERIIKSVSRVVIHGTDWTEYSTNPGEPDRFTIVTDEKASPKALDRTDLDPAAGDKRLIVGIQDRRRQADYLRAPTRPGGPSNRVPFRPEHDDQGIPAQGDEVAASPLGGQSPSRESTGPSGRSDEKRGSLRS